MTEFFPPETPGFTTATRNGYQKVLRNEHSPNENILTQTRCPRSTRNLYMFKARLFFEKIPPKMYDVNNIT